jgi:hypothetical protein
VAVVQDGRSEPALHPRRGVGHYVAEHDVWGRLPGYRPERTRGRGKRERQARPAPDLQGQPDLANAHRKLPRVDRRELRPVLSTSANKHGDPVSALPQLGGGVHYESLRSADAEAWPEKGDVRSAIRFVLHLVRSLGRQLSTRRSERRTAAASRSRSLHLEKNRAGIGYFKGCLRRRDRRSSEILKSDRATLMKFLAWCATHYAGI